MVTATYLQSIFKDKRVFVTGHTGFKGSWLIQILKWLGADVKGYALAPEKDNDLYRLINGDEQCYASVIADIKDIKQLRGEMVRFEPHFVFHLAAQALVRKSYDEPVDTFMVNAQGTAHVLDAIRSLEQPCVGVMITTDKVYENPERGIAFKEDDKLGGYDPYSASKAAAEIVIESYIRSFFNNDSYDNHHKSIAAARAGNVIGGGDYADDRIIPDIVRALDRGENVGLRNPNSIRPWQHVLEPLSAYLLLAAKMSEAPTKYNTAFNFGPDVADKKTVEELTQIFLDRYQQGSYTIVEQEGALHEAKLLMLDSNKAKEQLGWVPQLSAKEAIEWTADWYVNKEEDAGTKCLNQIKKYFGDIV